MSESVPPEGLGPGGLAIWGEMVAEFVLLPHEMRLLADIARTCDLIDALQVRVAAEGPVLAWGEGTRANPAAVEVRAQRMALGRMITQLRLVEDDSGEPVRRSRRDLRAERP